MNSGIHALKVPHAGSARKRGSGDTPELTVTQDLTNGHFLRCVNLVLGFLTINNVVAFFIGQMFLVARMLVEISHAIAQIKLNAPEMINAICQLCITIAHTTSGGAIIAPIEEPTLK